MNAGMFKAGNSPQGLFIERGKTITPLDIPQQIPLLFIMQNTRVNIKASHPVYVILFDTLHNLHRGLIGRKIENKMLQVEKQLLLS